MAWVCYQWHSSIINDSFLVLDGSNLLLHGITAPLDGKLGATCRPPAASRTSDVHRFNGYSRIHLCRSTSGPPVASFPPSALIRWLIAILGADEWFWSVNLRPAGRKLPSLGVYRSANGLHSFNLFSNGIKQPIDAINRLITLINWLVPLFGQSENSRKGTIFMMHKLFLDIFSGCFVADGSESCWLCLGTPQ